MPRFILVILCTLLISSPLGGEVVEAREGRLDLESWDWTRPCEIGGVWSFRWLGPLVNGQGDQTMVPVPGYWTGEADYPAYGSGIYSLEITGLDPGTLYGFHLREVVTAYVTWVNGTPSGGSGTYSLDPQKARGNVNHRTIPALSDPQGRIILEVAVSNFDYLRGGIGIHPLFGPLGMIQGEVKSMVTRDALVVGMMLAIALVFTLFSMVCRLDRVTLFFGLFSLSMALRMILQSSRFFHEWFSTLPLRFSFGLEILSAAFLLGFFLEFYWSFLERSPGVWRQVFHGINGLFALLMADFIPRVIEPLIFWFDLFALVVGVLVLADLVRAVWTGRRRAILVLVSLGILFLAALHDILFYLEIIQSGNMIQFGYLAFVLPISVSLSYHIARHVNQETAGRLALQSRLNSLLAQRVADLEEAARAAERANQAKTLFLANMSHEMRTPLHVILGNAEILAGQTETEDRTASTRIISQQAEHLARMIDSILDISRIESGKYNLHREAFSLSSLIRDLEESFAPLAERQGLSFQIRLPDSDPGLLVGDPVRLRQILVNLIQNALKFTSVGGIFLSAFLEEMEPDRFMTTLCIVDTGIGIDTQANPELFTPFTQGHQGTKKTYGGAGLGLALSRDLVRLMDGTMDMESELGRGTRFTLRIPFHKVNAAQPPETTPPSLIRSRPSPPLESGERPRSVLVVDDYTPNRDILGLHLSKAGHRVLKAETGAEALAVLEKEKLSLVFLDLHMPGMDGFDTIKAIRTLDQGEDLPVIGLSADALEQSRKEALEAGMDGFLTKPVKRETLIRIIEIADLIRCPPEIWDKRAFWGSMDHDRRDIRTVLEGFYRDTWPLVKSMVEEASVLSAPELHRMAHSIKGGALNIMARDLALHSQALEKACRSGSSEEIPELVEAVAGSFRRWERAWEAESVLIQP